MYYLFCPRCGEEQTIEADELPVNTSDVAEHECTHCYEIFEFGWYPEVELR